MKTNTLLSIISLFFLSNYSIGQSLIGFWEVKEVLVGERKMTPVAKWTKINSDGTYQSGNGWTQNSIGNWTFNHGKKEYTPNNENGIKDEFGPFLVSFLGNNMIWNRKENGINVTVKLESINQLPMATVDKLIGLWDLTKAYQLEKDITSSYNLKNNYFIFFRPDRLYLERHAKDAGKRATGFWYIDGHKPIVTLLDYENLTSSIKWRAEPLDNKLTLYGDSEENKNIKLIFKRIQEFKE